MKTRVVLDTNVIVDHFRALDLHCSAAVAETIKRRFNVVVCEKLLYEYHNILANRGKHLLPFVDLFLMQLFPIEILEKKPTPQVRIQFGPPEDRYHMQLAIDSSAQYHVTKDQAVLAEQASMARFGVDETDPRGFVQRIAGRP